MAPHVLHLFIVQPLANFLLMSQLLPETALVRLTLTLLTTLVPFPSSSPSPRHSVTQPQPSQIVAHLHESLASQSLQQGLSRLSPWPHSHLHDPSLSDSYPLSRSNIFPPTKSLTGKQLQNRSLQDFLIDLLEMPWKQLGRKVTIMLGAIGDARTCWMVDVLTGSTDTDYNKLY